MLPACPLAADLFAFEHLRTKIASTSITLAADLVAIARALTVGSDDVAAASKPSRKGRLTTRAAEACIGSHSRCGSAGSNRLSLGLGLGLCGSAGSNRCGTSHRRSTR